MTSQQHNSLVQLSPNRAVESMTTGDTQPAQPAPEPQPVVQRISGGSPCWNDHCDPDVHRNSCAGNRILWRDGYQQGIAAERAEMQAEIERLRTVLLNVARRGPQTQPMMDDLPCWCQRPGRAGHEYDHSLSCKEARTLFVKPQEDTP